MVPPDFRSDPSESPEGKGRARRAWDAYAKGLLPISQPIGKVWARKATTEMVGFWVLWHVYGGFEGLHERYGMHPATIWRKVAKFRLAFGVHPDEFDFPGITVDPVAYWTGAAAATGTPEV